jgi:glycosyltransferase involved in cell wall biosynthesis
MAVSEATKQKLIQRAKLKPEKIRVIYNFVNVEYFSVTSVNRENTRSTFGLPTEGMLLGFVGRLNPIKNLTTLISAMPEIIKKFPSAHLVLAGGGPLEVDLKMLVATLQLQERVHFLGKVSEMPAFYAALDINFLISHDENLSKVLLEAAAMHVYSIVSDVGGNAEVVNPQIGRVLNEANTDTIIQALSELVGQPKDPSAFEHVVAKFSVENHVRQTERLYTQLLSPTERTI